MQEVTDSSSVVPTRKPCILCFSFFMPIYGVLFYAAVAESADAPDLESGGKPCRFNSCQQHQNTNAGVSPAFFVFIINNSR